MKKGMRTLRQDGWQKIIKGETTPEEVMKVTPVEEYQFPDSSIAVNSKASPAELPVDTPLVMRPPQEFNLTKDIFVENRVYDRLHREISMRYKAFKTQEELFKGTYTPEQISVTKNISAGGLLFTSDRHKIGRAHV